MFYLIVIFLVLFFLLAWRRLDWAVMFLIAALPAYLIRFNIFGLPSTLLEVMIWVVFLVWFFKNFSRVKNNFLENFKRSEGKIKVRYPFDWEIVLLAVVALVAAGAAGFSPASLGIWKAYFFEPALFFVVVFNVMNGEKGREKILWAMATSALAVSLLAIYQKITGQLIDNPLWAAAATRRAVSFFGYPNAVGLYLGPIVLVMMGWLVETITKKQETITKQIIALTIILSALSIYFAKSKGALLGVAAGLVVFGLLAGKKARWLTMAVVLVAVVSVLAYQPTRQLTLDTVRFKTLSGQIRMVGWQESWKMLKDGRLITGAGLANYQAAAAPYHAEGFFIKNDDPEWLKKIRASAEYRKQRWQPLEIYLYPHNIVLNFWSELGLAGMILFVWIILKYFWLGISNLSLRGSASDRSNLRLDATNQRLLRSPGSSQGSLAMTNEFLVIGLIGAMVVIIIHGIVDAPYFKNDLAVMFWLFIAMMSMINLEKINN